MVSNIFHKQKRMVVYGRTSLLLDFKLTRENDDLFSSRYKNFFEVPHPVQEYTKMQIPDKKYLTNTAGTFWVTRRASALCHLGLDHFDILRTEIRRIQVTVWSTKL